MVYSLVDQQGSLALTLAMAALGQPLEPREGGRLVQPGSGIGEIELRPGPGDSLTIRFGPDAEAYQRLTADAADAAAFAAAAVGTYYSADADATATITAEGGALTIRTSNGLGEVTAPLIPLSARVGYTKPGSLMATFRTVITLDPGEGGTAAGFHLATARTRHLEFRRA